MPLNEQETANQIDISRYLDGTSEARRFALLSVDTMLDYKKDVYHTWVVTPDGAGGTKIVVEPGSEVTDTEADAAKATMKSELRAKLDAAGVQNSDLAASVKKKLQ